MDCAAIQDALRRYFAAHGEGLAAVWLFGSVARGTARETSDVDVAVLFEARPPSVLNSPAAAIEGELERLLRRPVQIVVMNTAPPDVAIRVLRAQCLLHEGNASTRIRFEVRARNEYFDVEPILRRYRRLERTR